MRVCTHCATENTSTARHCRHCGGSLRQAVELHDPGTVVGYYRILRLIGSGGFGAVYEAEVVAKPTLRIALKETFNPAHVRSFQSEFDVLHRIHHDCLPHYHEMFEEGGSGYLVMELIPGMSLEEVIKQRQGDPLSKGQVMGYAWQMCDVLQFLHTQSPPLFHRDIKPANIRLRPDGLIKLVDFGLLKQGSDTTRSSRMGLTPAYAPLEQWGSAGMHTDQRSDLYSLGATLYHLLTGRVPPSATERLSATTDPLIPPRQHNPRISPAVSDAVVTAMAVHPRDRYQQVSDLRQALVGSTPTPPPAPATIPVAPPPTPSPPPDPETIPVAPPPCPRPTGHRL